METMGIGQSIVITIFSMTVVFLVLLSISFLIDLLRIIVEKSQSKKSVDLVETIENKKMDMAVEETKENNMSDEELVAVISAAIAASMGLDIPDINIRSIKRVDNGWKDTARNEQVLKNI